MEPSWPSVAVARIAYLIGVALARLGKQLDAQKGCFRGVHGIRPMGV